MVAPTIKRPVLRGKQTMLLALPKSMCEQIISYLPEGDMKEAFIAEYENIYAQTAHKLEEVDHCTNALKTYGRMLATRIDEAVVLNHWVVARKGIAYYQRYMHIKLTHLDSKIYQLAKEDFKIEIEYPYHGWTWYWESPALNIPAVNEEFGEAVLSAALEAIDKDHAYYTDYINADGVAAPCDAANKILTKNHLR